MNPKANPKANPEAASKQARSEEALRTESSPTVPLALTIAGFDPSNGAGITADLQVFAAHGLFGLSAISSLTVQSTLGVSAVQPVSAEWLHKTVENLAADLPPDGVKIGMLGSADSTRTVAAFLRTLNPSRRIPVVLDPVLRSSSGHELLPAEALAALQQDLLPLVDWVTPNWEELAKLTALPVGSLAEARAATEALAQRYKRLHVVATAGERETVTDLLRTPDGPMHEFPGEPVQTRSTHGTGCAFSSALLARLVLGDRPAEAVAGAKAYVTEALRSAPGLGHGRGPLNLLWPLRH